MKFSKRSLLYTAYIVGITVFFLYYLFPSDTVKMYLAYRLSQGNPDLTVSIDRVSPALPPGIRLHDVGIAYRNEALVDLDSLKVVPNLLSLFSSKTTVKFNGRVHAGALSGRAEINNSRETFSVKIEGRISGAQVQTIPVLQLLTAHQIFGGLDGNFTYADVGPNQSMEGKIALSDCRIELATPVFSLESLAFKDVSADLVLNKKNMIIKNGSARGNQLDVDLAGTIASNNVLGKNALNLTGLATPHHALLAKIEKSFPIDLLRRKKAGNDPISFKIGGTLDEPGFSLN